MIIISAAETSGKERGGDLNFREIPC